MSIRLLVLKGLNFGKSYNLVPGNRLLIGRGNDCDVQLADASVSRHHCQITVKAGRAVLEDLNSTWGTIVNGEKVGQRQLEPNDIINLGQTQLKFEVSADANAVTWEHPVSEIPVAKHTPSVQKAPPDEKRPKPAKRPERRHSPVGSARSDKAKEPIPVATLVETHPPKPAVPRIERLLRYENRVGKRATGNGRSKRRDEVHRRETKRLTPTGSFRHWLASPALSLYLLCSLSRARSRLKSRPRPTRSNPSPMPAKRSRLHPIPPFLKRCREAIRLRQLLQNKHLPKRKQSRKYAPESRNPLPSEIPPVDPIETPSTIKTSPDTGPPMIVEKAAETPPGASVRLTDILPLRPEAGPLISTNGPVPTIFEFDKVAGWLLTPDSVTLVVAIPSKAQLIFVDTVAGKESRRLELDFKPGAIALQGDLIYAAGEGSTLVYALDFQTGEVKNEYNLPGSPARAIACHNKEGAIFLTDTSENLIAISPKTGDVVKTKGRGMFLAMDPTTGKYVYTGTNRPSKDYVEGSRGPNDTVRFRLVTVAERAAVLKYEVNGTELELVGGNSNTAIGFGGSLHLSPDGKRFAMVAGGGWWSEKDQRIRHDIAVFDPTDMTTMLGGLKAGGPHSITFHPALDLTAAHGTGGNYFFYRGKAMIADRHVQILAPGELTYSFNLFTFGGKGTRLISLDGSYLKLIPLELKYQQRATLEKEYGELPPAPIRIVSTDPAREQIEIAPLHSGCRYPYNPDTRIGQFPKELEGGLLLSRPRGELTAGLEPGDLTFERETLVCAAVLHKWNDEIKIKPEELEKWTAAGWHPTEGAFSLLPSHPSETLEWKLFCRVAKPGDAVDSGTEAGDTIKIFMMR